jgi:hypothetical protein
VARQFLLEVDSEPILHGGLKGVGTDFRPERLARQEIVNRPPVNSHVGMVHERQEPGDGGMIRNHSRTKFQFEVFCSGAMQIPVQVGAVGHLGHQGLREAKRPVAVVVFGNHADALAAGVGGIVVGAVVVDSPIQD